MGTPNLITMNFRFIDETRKLLEAVDKEKRKRMLRGGSLVRTIMKRSIRFRKRKKSQEGDPPFAHVRGFGLRSIFYAWDPSTETVVIGPVVGDDRTNAPQALEFGGYSMISVSTRDRRRSGRRRIRARIKRRPYSFPALEKASDKYPEVFKGLI